MAVSLPKREKSLLDEVLGLLSQAEPPHNAHTERFEHFYRLYRSYTQFKRDAMRVRTRRDADDLNEAAKREFGDLMFVPMAFAIVETTLPRMLAQNPSMVIRPREAAWEDAVEPLKVLLEVQQQRITYPLVLQDVAKDGLMYGLGVEKVWYERKVQQRTILEKAIVPTDGAEWVQGTREVVSEGPQAECIDPWDFIPDPIADAVENMRFAFHRSWRDDRYIKGKIERKEWQLPRGVSLDDLLSACSAKREEVWQGRNGVTGTPSSKDKGKIHEVLEFHDGARVVTIVDRECPVQDGDNPFWHGQLPFHVFRPTRVTHELVGIGEIEAIEDLQDELNELRTSRRDNARLVLQRPLAYWDGMIDPGVLEFGPGKLLPMEGDPRELIFPIPLQELPGSAFQESAELKQDVQYVSGIDDATAGAGADQQTATGTQLVQAAANVRIQNKVLRLEHEVIRGTARQWVALNQQHITTKLDIAGPPQPGEEDRDFSWYSIGPQEIEGEFEIEVVGGSTQPENPVQKRNDAQLAMQMFGQNPAVDQRKLVEYALRNMDVPQPATWLTPQEPQVPMVALEQVRAALADAVQSGDPNQVMQLLDPATFDSLVQGAMQPAGPGEPGGPQEGPPPPPGAAPAQAPPQQ